MTRVKKSRELVDWAQSVLASDGDLLSDVLRLGLERLMEAEQTAYVNPTGPSGPRAAARLKEHHEDWITGRRYIDMSRRRDENLGPPEEDEVVSPAV